MNPFSFCKLFPLVFLASQLMASPVLAMTNQQAICDPSRRCVSGTPCGSGASCETGDRLRSAAVCNLTAAGEGRCITSGQQTCLTDDACLRRDVDAATTPPGALPSICCLCGKTSQNACITTASTNECGRFTQSASFRSFSESHPAEAQGITCSRPLTQSECRSVGNGGICVTGPGTISDVFGRPVQGQTGAPASGGAPAASRPPIVPELGVPIPGLRFTQPSTEAGTITVSFLAQYISAAYRYAISIVAIVAIIMVVYGGFRYLIGSAAGDVKRGKEIIKDAIIGLIIVLSIYVILNTVNPATLNPTGIQLASIIPVTDNVADSNANDIENSIPGEPSGGQPALNIPQPVTWAYCENTRNRVGSPPLSRYQMKATLRPVNIRERSATWCADCSSVSCGNNRTEPDPICRQIAGVDGDGVPCGGSFGVFLRGMTANCRGKHMDNVDGLDGLTFGIQDLVIWNVPELLRAADQIDHENFVRLFQNADMDQWYQGGNINRDWFCQQQISQKGLVCHSGFRTALRTALRTRAFVIAQLRRAYSSWRQRMNSAAAHFSTMKGRAMWAALLNNPGACGTSLAPLVNACRTVTPESAKIECFLNQSVVVPCRNNVDGARSRAQSIRQALRGIPDTEPAGGDESLEGIISRCVPNLGN